MERSDWSRAFHHQGAPRENPLLSLKCADFGVLSDWSRAITSLLCGDTVARGRYSSIVSTDLIGREQSRDLSMEAAIFFCYHLVLH